MNTLDIILLIVLLVLFCKIGIPMLRSEEQYKSIQNNEIQHVEYKKNNNYNDNKNDDENDDKKLNKYLDIILKAKYSGKNKKIKVNDHFIEHQWHTDYRDTQNAFEMVVPNRKQLFNLGALPVEQVSEIPQKDAKYLVHKFIKEINKTIKNKVSNELSSTSWMDNMPQQKIESGWDKQQKALGLPTSIYKEPAKKAPIKLIKIDHAEKYETEKEIRYTLFLIIQKKHVKDQLVIKVNFVVDKNDVNMDRDFFAKDKGSFRTNVMIEEISVIGFLTKNEFGKRTRQDDFYKFDNITDGRMFSQEQIIKELNRKKAEYAKEMQDA
jgi:hypothetical protein